MESIGKRNALIGIIAVFICDGWTVTASAITMQVSPTTAAICETVTVTR